VNLEGADLGWAFLMEADLSGADLSLAFLMGAHLSRADLSLATLMKADLVEADLVEANLCGAQLNGATLMGADLTGANLRQANLKSANLDGAKLNQAQLNGADLTGVSFKAVHLFQADLSGVRFVGADLEWADLSGVNLAGADLSESHLVGTDLSAANLSGVNLRGAWVGDTRFGDLDLRTVKGLESLVFLKPCTVGIDTVYRSEGEIPFSFLRGAGVPTNFIEYMRSLVGTAFDYYSCFISYSRKDQEFADRLHADLQAKGVRCWLATEDLKIGDKFRQRIDEAIRFHDKLLVVLSETSVNSSWVEKEVLTAFEKEKDKNGDPVLFPIRLDEAVMNAKQEWAGDIRRTRQIGDFRNWLDHNFYQKAFQRLLRDLQGGQQKEAAVGPQGD
jgi:uncharacterized protein YjbI with pentapeptide repeats